MTVIIVVLIVICTIVVIIEEWFTNSQLIISSSIASDNISSNSDIDSNRLNPQQQQLQKPPVQQPVNQVPKNYQSELTGHNQSIFQGRCWLNEEFSIIKPCSLCATYELETSHTDYHTNIHLCSKTGYKELIRCVNTGFVERACYTNWRQFFTFLSLTGLFGGIAGLLTKHRQHLLKYRTLARFRKPVHKSPDSSEPESHTLVDIDPHTH